MILEIQRELAELGEPADAEFLQRFFKTGPRQYGEGDRFRGIRVPILRRLVKKYRIMPLSETVELLKSAYHEDRLMALLILVEKYRKSDGAERATIHRLYLDHTRYINNWDLVDVSAEHVVGAHLDGAGLALLDRLARSPMLWERRIAILATFYFIRRGVFEPTLRIAECLLSDRHDLIHKAVGWMLREVGKRDAGKLEKFLDQHCAQMPRTMLRYAIERFPEPRRREYLNREARKPS
jgi:3-methyladenine DNA glycosylase AlkD